MPKNGANVISMQHSKTHFKVELDPMQTGLRDRGGYLTNDKAKRTTEFITLESNKGVFCGFTGSDQQFKA